jgi:DNA-binding NarL/FixJ family response regulator
MSPLRVVVGEADPLCLAGITCVLRRAGVEVVGSAGNAGDLARETAAHHPDVAIVDMDMPPMLGDEDPTEVVRGVRAIDPRMAILILSELPEYALAVLGDQPAGFGFLVKARITDAEDFTASVRQVARGGTAIDPVVVSRLAGLPSRASALDDLTKRERQVLTLIAQGRTNGCIAAELVVTKAAVERHVSGIFAKLDLRANGRDHRRVLAVLRYLDCQSPRRARAWPAQPSKRPTTSGRAALQTSAPVT